MTSPSETGSGAAHVHGDGVSCACGCGRSLRGHLARARYHRNPACQRERKIEACRRWRRAHAERFAAARWAWRERQRLAARRRRADARCASCGAPLRYRGLGRPRRYCDRHSTWAIRRSAA